MPTQKYALRRENLRKRLYAKGLQGLLVTLDANRYYLSGFELHDAQVNESSGCLLVMADGRDWLFTDNRYFDTAKKFWDVERIFIYSGNAGEQINKLLSSLKTGPFGFEAQNTSVAFFQAVSEGLLFERADGLVEGLRVIKDDDELARLEKACALNHQMMHWLPSELIPGRTEADIAWEVEQYFRNNGAEELAFSSIVAVNANAALPHAIPSEEKLIENCAVLVDVGCRLGDYCSDQTRTFWVGDNPHPDYITYYGLIQEAQQKAINLIRPGVAMCDVYKAAWEHLEKYQVAKYFTHGLGHGIGLQTHEAPSLSPRSDALLRAGMVVTVEPGLYKAGYGGVRFEYMVLVTDDGARVL